MSAVNLDDNLQKGILGLPTSVPPSEIKRQSVRLAGAFHDRGLAVVRVKVAWSPDRGDLPRSRAVKPEPSSAPPAEFAEFPEDFLPEEGDIVIVKRHQHRREIHRPGRRGTQLQRVVRRGRHDRPRRRLRRTQLHRDRAPGSGRSPQATKSSRRSRPDAGRHLPATN
jgi:hypothetical protein